MTPKGHMVIRSRRDLHNDPKGHVTFLSSWPQKVTWSLEAAVTYCMTLKLKVTFLVGLA